MKSLVTLKLSDPTTPQVAIFQGADVLCFVELDCYHECGWPIGLGKG